MGWGLQVEQSDHGLGVFLKSGDVREGETVLGCKKCRYVWRVVAATKAVLQVRECKACRERAAAECSWAQCDACGKWRRLVGVSSDDLPPLWECRLNGGPLSTCEAPEEDFDEEEERLVE